MLLFPVALVLGIVALVRTGRRRTRGGSIALAAVIIATVELAGSVVAVLATVLSLATIAPLPADVSAPVDATARRLVVGNCLEHLPADGDVATARVVPCAEPHEARVTSTTTLHDGTWPGQRAVDQQVAATCRSAAATNAAGSVRAWAPTVEGWQRGDRTGLCLLVTHS